MPTTPTFTVCICTRNRPDDLRNALDSARKSTTPIRVVVSDDSTSPVALASLACEYPEVHFVPGPRRGLGANRNNALKEVTTTHVAFIDDDVLLDSQFFSRITEALHASEDAGRLIITGSEINRGSIVLPHKPTFLGFQALDYQPHETLRSIVINSTVFPTSLFDSIAFDENIIYGGEELDIAAQAVYLAKYRILLLPSAANHHFPSAINRSYYAKVEDASRIFVMFKCYRVLQRKFGKAACFLAIAYAHNLLANLKRRKLHGIAAFWSTFQISLKYISAL